MKLIDFIKSELVGKKIYHTNTHNRKVSLIVEDVKVVDRRRQITPDTRENDWYGESVDWQELKILFEDGSSIQANYHTEMEISTFNP